MVVIDASVWVSMLNADDSFHARAENIFESLAANSETICIPAIAFTEVAGAIRRTTKDDNVASGAVYYMKGAVQEVMADFEKLEPIATDMAIKYSIKGMDAYYLAVAELTKSKLHTFDQQQEEAFEAIRRRK